MSFEEFVIVDSFWNTLQYLAFLPWNVTLSVLVFPLQMLGAVFGFNPFCTADGLCG
jgi:hypothetical protein